MAKVDELTDPTGRSGTERRRTGGGRRRPRPLAWVILLGAILGLVLGIRACLATDPYPEDAVAVATGTADLGGAVSGLSEQLEVLDHLQLFERVDAWQRTAAAHLSEAETLTPPPDFRRAHSLLVASVALRAEALERYEPALRNALGDMDPEVAAGQLAGVMRDLVLADRAYELFRGAWPDERDVPPPAAWMSDETDPAERARAFVAELRAHPALLAVYDLRIVEVATAPEPAGLEGETDVLPPSDVLAVTVRVENAGNQRVPAAPVTAVLTSETDPQPQTLEGAVDALEPGAQGTVTLSGLRTAVGGGTHLLRVTVGPVAGEQDLEGNTVEYKFLVRDP